MEEKNMNKEEVLRLVEKYMDAVCAAMYAAYLTTADYSFLAYRKQVGELSAEIKQHIKELED
jgi:hypothetical protein